jgi:hypothetical protein
MSPEGTTEHAWNFGPPFEACLLNVTAPKATWNPLQRVINSAQCRGWTFPDEPQGVQSEAGLLEGSRQFLLLCFRKSDLLRANVIVHPRERLQALYLVAEKLVHFVEGRLTQCRGFGFCQHRGGLEHGGECPAGDFGILDQFVG